VRQLALWILVAGCNRVIGVQGSGTAAHDTRRIAGFDSIDVRGAVDAEIVVGSGHAVSIDGDDNIVPLVKTTTEGSILTIQTEGSFHTHVPLIVHVELPSFNGLVLSGAGHVRVQNVQGGVVVLDVSGDGKITAAGSAHEAQVDLSGAGSIDASALHLERAVVDVTGAGDIDVYASQAVSATISGAGHIRYAGNPPQVDKKVSGVGAVEAR
jgi:hypothetical protein